MTKIYDILLQDIRFEEGLHACMHCGVCTAICPASEFYKYDPRQICGLVQNKDDEKLIELLKSDTIWYCGECMSCKTRCPRGNVPGLVIMALRKVSQELGYFTESEKGRQQFALKRVIGENIVNTGYCVHVDIVDPKMHMEQGPVWEWYRANVKDVSDRLGANYNGNGAGALKKVSEKDIEEIRKIFEATGANNLFDKIELYSKEKAKKMNIGFEDEGINNEYFYHVYLENKNNHQN